MELPKNITQIGESNHRCKIYVEDYVISYMKQLNQLARDKDMAVALYGVQKQENEASYLFLYGACKLTFLQRETRHLSQAQQQEIEKHRTQYFPEYSFLGYRLLNGEMIEGFHICEQGICRYIAGYAQFYEKNDSMLAYMLDVREDARPEVVDRQKYEVVKKKQEERRIQQEESKLPKTAFPGSSNSLKGMRVAVVLVFAFLCLIGLSSLNSDEGMGDLQAMARQVMDDAMEQRIPDAESEIEVVQTDSLIAEDKLAEAVFQENAAVSVPETEEAEEPTITKEDEVSAESIAQPEPEIAVEPEITAEPKVEVSSEPQRTSYIIEKGDTLIGISVQNYGSDTMVSEICELNQIKNPDDIKVGQKILLP